MTSIESQVSDSLTSSPPLPPSGARGQARSAPRRAFQGLKSPLASAGLADFPVVFFIFVMELTQLSWALNQCSCSSGEDLGSWGLHLFYQLHKVVVVMVGKTSASRSHLSSTQVHK